MNENEKFNSKLPPKNIKCRTCKYAKKPVLVRGKLYQRYTHNDCQKYTVKPLAVLWNGEDCPKYERIG